MSKFIFECIDCKKHYIPSDVEYLCAECEKLNKPMQPLRGMLRCIYDYGNISKNFSRVEIVTSEKKNFSRYLDILPIDSPDSIPPLVTGPTPLRRAMKLEHDFGVDEIWIKDDTVLPTGSFKDRASSMVVAIAAEKGIETIATASTGNAATALAGMAASAELSSVIFVPESAPKAKLTQIAVYGGRLVPIKGNYDQAFELSTEACREYGWYNRNTACNPFTIEGKKTAALEIWEQMEFSAPDWVVVPTGDGVILAGIEKGFSDLHRMGLVEKMPKLAVIQAEGCQPIVKSFLSGNPEIEPELTPRTIADSISVGVPRAGRWVMQALSSCGGTCLAVSDEEIISAIAYLGSSMGVFAEPAAATAVAGLKKMIESGSISGGERVAVLVTGNGLKDVPAASQSVEFPHSISPDLKLLRKIISR